MIISSEDLEIESDSEFTFQIETENDPTLFEIVSGSLPDGLTLNQETGVISGNPYELGPFVVTIKASNAFGEDTYEQNFLIYMYSVPSIISPAIAPVYTIGQPFSYQIICQPHPLAYIRRNPDSFDAENLPDGLSVNSTTGFITGTPTESALNMTVKAINVAGTSTRNVINDTIAPFDPTEISASNIQDDEFMLSWTLAYPADNAGVKRVEIHRNGVLYLEDNATGSGSRLIQLQTPGTTNLWKIRVKDAQGNLSGFSEEIEVTQLS